MIHVPAVLTEVSCDECTKTEAGNSCGQMVKHLGVRRVKPVTEANSLALVPPEPNTAKLDQRNMFAPSHIAGLAQKRSGKRYNPRHSAKLTCDVLQVHQVVMYWVSPSYILEPHHRFWSWIVMICYDSEFFGLIWSRFCIHGHLVMNITRTNCKSRKWISRYIHIQYTIAL